MRYKDFERLQKAVDEAEKAAVKLSDSANEGIRVGLGAMRDDRMDKDLERLVNKLGWLGEMANVSRKIIGSMKEVELEEMRDHTK